MGNNVTKTMMGVFAWIAPAPFLHYIRRTSGWRSRVAFWLVSLCAWCAVVLKIMTHPLPAVAALGWGGPLSVVFVVPYLTWPGLRRRLGENTATLAFGTMMVVGEWSLHAALPFGVWGSAANTQLDQLALLQLSSVTGLHGVSFLIYTVAAVLERLLNGERCTVRRAALVAAAAVAGTCSGSMWSRSRCGGHAAAPCGAPGLKCLGLRVFRVFMAVCV